LKQLFTLPVAQVEEANADIERVVDGLCYTSKAKWQAFDTKFDLNTPKDPDRESSIGANVTPAQT
jgi:hypothetical protein